MNGIPYEGKTGRINLGWALMGLVGLLFVSLLALSWQNDFVHGALAGMFLFAYAGACILIKKNEGFRG